MNISSDNINNQLSRRRFVKMSVQGGAAALLISNGMLYGKSLDKIKVGLIGCGGRGTRAGIIDCAQSAAGIELIAMCDIFEDHVKSAPEQIKTNLQKRGLSVKDIYKVTPETTFVGFDAYKKVIACDVDMVILTTPPYFRPEHLRAAVEAGKHIFMEKPVAVDPVGVRSVMESADMAMEKGLAIVAGTQLRRLEAYRETVKRIHNGDIGDITGGQVVRSGGAMRNWKIEEKTRKPEWTEMEYHIRRWLFWTWLSGDFVTEMHVHNLDIMNWILQSHPLKCMGVGGRQVRTEKEYGDVYRKAGFRVVSEYFFLHRVKQWNDTLISKSIVPYRDEYYTAAIELDKKISGEEREPLIKEHLDNCYLYLDNHELTGFYLPDLGEGLILAGCTTTGLELMKIKYSKVDKAVLPSENSAGIDFLKRHGFSESGTKGKRMILGKEIPWKPDCIFSRIGGNYG